MIDKYRMTVEQNIFVAKRNIIDYMWKSARLEGLSVTYPDTASIFNGLTVQGISVKDTIAVNNLKHSWQFILDNIDYPTDYNFVCAINKVVGGDNIIINAGYLRKMNVSIGGTSWKPEIPSADKVKSDIESILGIENTTQRSITLMLYLMRSQLFMEGNKRTAMLAANHEMISGGAGIISVPIECQHEFLTLLVDYYETGETETIMDFVYDSCIDGIEFEEENDTGRDDFELEM